VVMKFTKFDILTISFFLMGLLFSSSNFAATTVATTCSAGTYKASSTATTCTSASIGYYVPSSGSTFQTKCPVGTYSAKSGASTCTSASIGSYVDTAGSSTQTSCGNGKTTTTTGSTASTACMSSATTCTTSTPCISSVIPAASSVFINFSYAGTASYYIASCTKSGASTPIVSSKFASSPIFLSGLTNNSAYSCTVKAYTSSGTPSSASAAVSGTPQATTATSLITPSVNGVLPSDSRISVQFNFAGSKITSLSSAADTPPTSYVAICTSSDGGVSNSSLGSAEYSNGTAVGNQTNPLIVSGLTNGKTYTCGVMGRVVQGTNYFGIALSSTSSSSVIPNAGPSNSLGVLSSTANSSVVSGYKSYCDYTNQTAAGTGAVPSITYSLSSSSTSSATSKATYTCADNSRTLTGNALPDHLSSKFFTNGLAGYTSSPYNSGNPNKIGTKSISKAVPMSATSPYTGTISSAYSAGSSGFDTRSCYSYTTSSSPNSSSTTTGAYKVNNVYFCTFVSYAYANNSVLIEPGTAETYAGSTTTYKVVGKNIYQDVGLDPSNAHNQPTMSGQTMAMYGNYHYHGIPEGHVARIGKGNSTMTLVAFASDGFPIYARYGYSDRTKTTGGVKIMKSNYRLRTAAELTAAGYTDRPSATLAPYGVFEQDWVFDATSGGDLDACNGRYGVTPESPTTAVYHYYITDSYPFVQRCVFGTPSSWANGAN
jgi:hypothetical protein